MLKRRQFEVFIPLDRSGPLKAESGALGERANFASMKLGQPTGATVDAGRHVVIFVQVRRNAVTQSNFVLGRGLGVLLFVLQTMNQGFGWILVAEPLVALIAFDKGYCG